MTDMNLKTADQTCDYIFIHRKQKHRDINK